MARKTLDTLKAREVREPLQPVTLTKTAKKFLEQVASAEVPEILQPDFDRFLHATQSLEEEWQRNDEIFKRVDRAKVSPEAQQEFASSLARIDTYMRAMFKSWDAYTKKLRHIGDRVVPSEEDLRAIAAASLSDKMDELQFTINYGMLGSKLAQSLRDVAAEVEMDTAPQCAPCA